MLAIGILALMLLLAYAEYQMYQDRSDRQIEVTVSFSPTRLARGDAGEMRVRVEHVGWLPIPWVTFSFELPQGLDCPAARFHVVEGRIAVPYRGGIVRHYPVTPQTRGLHRLEQPIRVEFTDPLGFVARRLDLQSRAELLAYPWPRDAAVAAPTRSLMGSIEHAALLEDPTATRGVRPYAPGDPLRRIHWPQTARTGEIMAREYATAVDAQVYIVANLETHTPHWLDVDRERLECVIEVVAGMALEACRIALPVGLVVNGVAFEATPVTRVGPSASPRHLAHYLDVLARLAAYPAESAETLLRSAAALPREASLVLVTSVVPLSWQRALASVARRRPLTLVLVARPEDALFSPSGVTVVRLPVLPGQVAENTP